MRKLFNRKGEFIANKANCKIVDCILIIIASNKTVASLFDIQLELWRCGFRISHPDLKKLIKFLEEQRLITENDYQNKRKCLINDSIK